MQLEDTIHKGKVVSISQKKVRVLILSTSSCSACHLNGGCTSADVREKYVEAIVKNTSLYKKGDEVWVTCSDKQGFYALFWAYIFPLFLVLFLLFFVYSMTQSELYAGMGSLAVLPFYYLYLYVKRRFFEHKINVKIKNI